MQSTCYVFVDGVDGVGIQLEYLGYQFLYLLALFVKVEVPGVDYRLELFVGTLAEGDLEHTAILAVLQPLRDR